MLNKKQSGPEKGQVCTKNMQKNKPKNLMNKRGNDMLMYSVRNKLPTPQPLLFLQPFKTFIALMVWIWIYDSHP